MIFLQITDNLKIILMNWLKNLWDSGNLGTVDTDVTIETKSIIAISIAVVVVTVIIVLVLKFAKKL